MTDDLDRQIASAVARIAAERPPVGDVVLPGSVVARSQQRGVPGPVVAIVSFALVVVAGLGGYLLLRTGESPSPAVATAERVPIEAADGVELAGRFYPGEGDGVVIGTAYGWDALSLAPVAEALSGAGVPVLVVDLRGVGDSPGETSVESIPADLAAAVSWLGAAEGVDRVFLMGFSHSGTGALVAAATPGLEIAGVASMMGFPEYQGLDARSAIGDVMVPVHLVGASQDVIFSSAGWALELFTAASQPKTIEVLPPLAPDADFMETYGALMADSMLIFMGGV